MIYASYHLRQRRLFLPVLSSSVGAIGFLILTPDAALAQPPEPPTPRQRAEQRAQERQGQMFARMMAQRPTLVQSRALSPDGKTAVSYNSTGTLIFWDAATGKELRTLVAYEDAADLDPFSKAQFSPDGKLLFTVATVKSPPKPETTGPKMGVVFKLWEVATGKLLWTLPEMNDGVRGKQAINSVTFSSDGKLLATKARYAPIHVWEIATGKLLSTLTVPFMELNAIAFSPDGKTLAGGGYRHPSYNSEILFWNVQSGEMERSIKQPDSTLGNQILAIQFSPDGKRLAVGGGIGKYERLSEDTGRFNAQYGVAQLWDVKIGVLMSSLGRPVHRDLVTTLAFSPDETRLATGSYDQIVGLWDTRTGMLLSQVTRYGKVAPPRIAEIDATQKPLGLSVRDLVFSNEGKNLNILNDNNTVQAWDVALPTPPGDTVRRFIPNSNASYSSFAFEPNGHWLVSGDYSKQVRFWRADTQEETESFVAHDDPVLKVALARFLPDDYRYAGKAPLLVTASNLEDAKNMGGNRGALVVKGFEVKLWNSQNHELKRTLTVPDFNFTALAVSPGGKWVAAAGGQVGEIPEGALAANGVGVLTIAPGDPGPADQIQKKWGVVMLWDAATGELKHKFPVEGALPRDLAFSPDGNIVAGDGDEAGLTLWRTATGEAIRTLDEDRPPALKPGQRRVSFTFGQISGKETLAFSDDGTRLARSYKGTVKLWNTQTGELAGSIAEPEVTRAAGTHLIALAPDGKTLATCATKQPLKLWDVATGKVLWQSPDQETISALEMAPNGKILASKTPDGIQLLDISQTTQGIVK